MGMKPLYHIDQYCLNGCPMEFYSYKWNCVGEIFVKMILYDTVDGQNPAPPGMVKTL